MEQTMTMFGITMFGMTTPADKAPAAMTPQEEVRAKRRNAACALNGVMVKHVQDVALRELITRLQGLGRALGQRYGVKGDDATLEAYRSTLERLVEADKSGLNQREKSRVVTALTKAQELAECFD